MHETNVMLALFMASFWVSKIIEWGQLDSKVRTWIHRRLSQWKQVKWQKENEKAQAAYLRSGLLRIEDYELPNIVLADGWSDIPVDPQIRKSLRKYPPVPRGLTLEQARALKVDLCDDPACRTRAIGRQ